MLHLRRMIEWSQLALLAAGSVMYAASLSNADKQFMMTAARMDMTEAHEGQMAANQAVRSDVKDLGKMLTEDHTTSYQQLSIVAGKEAISIPKGIDSAKDRTISQLARLKGASFDSRFALDEVAAQRQELAAFKREAAHGKDADVKAYAAQMVPVLEKDLKLAEECSKAKPGK